MVNCIEGCETTKLYHDPRTPPLDTEKCLCKECYIGAIEDEISEHENDINLLESKLLSLD